MNVSLFLVVLALGASAASAMMTWSMLRRERERGAARIAALSAAIDPVPLVAMGEYVEPSVPTQLFARQGAPAHSGARIRMAVIGVMALVAIVVAARQYAPARRAAPAVAAAAAAATSPLELMSMRHVREGSTFVVRGLLRNPRQSAPVSGLTAVVFAFDRQGTFLTSARAPIDFTTLEPGDESPFAVTISAPGDVARYRVAFRVDAGVLRHVDRRDTGVSLATNRQ